MDFHLTREQELVRQMMHDFTENEVKPIAAETDKTSTYPRENIEKSCPSSALPPAISSLPTMVCAAARSLQTVLLHRRRSTSAC